MVPTHKIQIQANGSPQIIAASPDVISGSSAQVCLDPAGYSSDVDVRSYLTHNIDVVMSIIIIIIFISLLLEY